MRVTVGAHTTTPAERLRCARGFVLVLAATTIAWGLPMSSEGTPARFRPVRHITVDVKEPSDVVALPGGGFLIVGDQSDNLLVVARDGSSTKVDLKGVKRGASGLEALAFDPVAKRLFVSEEERRTLRRYRFDPSRVVVPELEEKIRLDLGGDPNKGVEGLCYLPAAHSPTRRPQLVIAKEREPRILALLSDTGTGEPELIPLPKGLKKGCDDFAALAIDPLTGHLFVASEESSSLAEIELRASGGSVEATLVGLTPLVDRKGRPFLRVEGITFDDAGDLHVLLEDRRELHHLVRVR